MASAWVQEKKKPTWVQKLNSRMEMYGESK
jgi:hypothetical protein